MTEEVTFNGVTISDFYQVAAVQRPIAGRSVVTDNISGMDGTKIVTSSMNGVTLVLSLVVDGGSEEMREAMRSLAPMLHTEGPEILAFASDNGLYYKAMISEVAFTEHVRSGILNVNFVMERPIMYGDVQSVTVPSEGVKTILVGGTYPTAPKASGTVNGSSNDNVWGLSLDNGRHIHIVTGSTNGIAVSIDCEERTATLAGATCLPTLDSDWFELYPGEHVIQNDVGSGSCTFEWQELWV